MFFGWMFPKLEFPWVCCRPDHPVIYFFQEEGITPDFKLSELLNRDELRDVNTVLNWFIQLSIMMMMMMQILDSLNQFDPISFALSFHVILHAALFFRWWRQLSTSRSERHADGVGAQSCKCQKGPRGRGPMVVSKWFAGLVVSNIYGFSTMLGMIGWNHQPVLLLFILLK